MIETVTQRGGAVRLTRVLIGIAAVCATSLFLIAGSASAKTIYQYVYSGEYFDGSGSSKGQFKSLAGIDYEPATQKLYVSVPGSPGVIDKFTKTGVPANFSALNNGAGRDYIDTGKQASGELSVDTSTAPSAGNIYLQSGGEFFGYHPNGLPIEPAFNETQFGEAGKPGRNLFGGCGSASGPNGEYWDFTRGNGQPEIHRRNLETFEAEVTYLTEGTFGSPDMCNLKVDSQGNFYGFWEAEGGFSPNWAVKLPPEPIADNAGGTAEKSPDREQRYRLNAGCCGITPTFGNHNPTHLGIDRSDDYVFATERSNLGPFGTNVVSVYDNKGGLVSQFGLPEGGYEGLMNAGGITVDPVTHDVYVTNNRDYGGEVRHVEKFVRGPSYTVPTTDTEQPTQPEVASKAILHGVVNPDGMATKQCYFEFGSTPSLGSKVPCKEGQEFSGGAGNVNVSAEITGLKEGTKYWVKVFAANENEIISDGGPEQFIAQSKPIGTAVFVSNVNTDGASFNATVDPNGGRTWYYWEYGTTTAYGQATPEKRLRREEATELELPEARTEPYVVKDLITGLQPGETYHFRLVAKDEQGTAVGEDHEFITYVKEVEPNCPNSLVRQQTGSALLLDCRAYELASTEYSGGHDVVSSIVPDQEPLASYPDASGRLLYSLDSAIVPGVSGDPTNLGRDPYVAVRGAEGWKTEYVGLPSGGMADTGMFGSPLLEADSSLNQFAFGGKDICEPCFEDGSTNIPLRRANGSLEKGMAGSLKPAANPVGEVRKRFSADGSTFVFGAEKKFESAGNEGSVSIYSRSLKPGGGTQVVSTLPNGTTMTGAGIAELDISANGERVLVGKRVSEDTAGNEYFDLYMHVGNSPDSVPVVSSPSGVIFNGMTADGSKVFFTTADPLAGDTDSSNDFFVAEVGASSSTITWLSKGAGGTGNTNNCEPVANWNVVSGGPSCGTVAIAGGGGVASKDGTAYFVSPELLDGAGNGIANQANLYVVKPGKGPHFVAVIDSSLVKPGPQPPNHPLVTSGFATGLSEPQAMTVDQANGDLYVIERGAGRLARFDSTGAPDNFTAGPNAGTNKITGLSLGFAGRAEVAVDDASGSPFQHDFYVKKEFGTIGLYAQTGAELGSLTGFGDACGVAVDPSSGVVYVGDRFSGAVWRFEPTSATTPVTNANYVKTGIVTQGMEPCNVAADSLGNVYASAQTTGPAKRFSASEFEAVPPSVSGTEVDALSRAMSVDPETNDLYINEGSQIRRFDSSGNLIQTFGSPESLGANSRGVAVNAENGHVYAPVGPSIVEFGIEPVPYEPIDNPAVAHGVRDSGTHSYEDFQISPDGRYALFSSVVPLTGYPNQGHSELFRYDSVSETLDCASCAPTLQAARSDVTMTPYGLSMTNDGRVFFTTKDSFTLRDTNGKKDAYEWSNGRTQLISSGLGPYDSALLSVSADGKDAFFFTRDVLAPQDGNGNAVKIYDAREDGGFLVEESRRPCAASDECHGAGTEQPGPPNIDTATGEGPPRHPAETGRCDSLAAKAKKSSLLAANLRRRADSSTSAAQAGKLRRRATQAARQARKLSREAKACRRSSGGGGK